MKSGWYQIFFRNWWVVAFVLMACGFYLQAIHKKNRLVKTLQERVDHLSQAKREAERKKEELVLRIQSQEDPEWLELVLKENLGVTAEGEFKVVFE